jgi:hypothetical protein
MLAIIFWSMFPVYAAAFVVVPDGWFPVLDDLSVMARTVSFFNGLAIYVFLWFGYCQFYFVVDRAISVRFMIELENAPGKRLTRQQLTEVYDLDEMLTRRLRQVVSEKYVIVESGYYRNSWKGHYEALLFSFLKRYLQLGRGG